MNNLDIAVLLVLISSTLVGFVRGALASILSTVGWMLAVIVNHNLFSSIEPFLEARFNSKLLTFLVGYVGGIIALLFLISIINFIILSALNQFKDGFIDKILGLIFGAARGGLIIAVVFLCFESGMRALSGEENNTKDYPEIVLDAASLPLMKKAELILVAYAPDNFKTGASFKKLISPEDKISDIVLLNLLRKLSVKVPKSDMLDINKSIDKNSQYMSEHQILIAKIKAVWSYYQQQEMQEESLSQEDLKKIHTILNS